MSKQKQRDKVAIVGWASSSRDQAPFDDESFDIWGCNELGAVHPNPNLRWDEWFNLHERAVIESIGKQPGQEVSPRITFLRKQTVPVWMKEVQPDIPASRAFPYQELIDRFSYDEDPYFTSSIAWQIAFAIHRGYKEIHVYGVDMALESEYAYQRPCCDYFIGIARGMGIKVSIPSMSRLCKGPWLYGLEEPPENEGFITQAMCHTRLHELNQRCGEIEQKRNALQNQFNQQMQAIMMEGATMNGARANMKWVYDQLLIRLRDAGMPVIFDSPDIVAPRSPQANSKSDGEAQPQVKRGPSESDRAFAEAAQEKANAA